MCYYIFCVIFFARWRQELPRLVASTTCPGFQVCLKTCTPVCSIRVRGPQTTMQTTIMYEIFLNQQIFRLRIICNCSRVFQNWFHCLHNICLKLCTILLISQFILKCTLTTHRFCCCLFLTLLDVPIQKSILTYIVKCSTNCNRLIQPHSSHH